MTIYDIIHVEDNPELRGFVEKSAKRQQLTYLEINSLGGLLYALADVSGGVFVVDGRFPRMAGGAVEFLAEEAIDIIRARDEGAKIILYSNSQEAQVIAQKKGVMALDKCKVKPRELVDKVREMLSC